MKKSAKRIWEAIPPKKAPSKAMTTWTSHLIQPMRTGIYQRLKLLSGGSEQIYYSYWDGRSWSVGKKKIESVDKPFQPTKMLNLKWRGFRKEQPYNSYDELDRLITQSRLKERAEQRMSTKQIEHENLLHDVDDLRRRLAHKDRENKQLQRDLQILSAENSNYKIEIKDLKRAALAPTKSATIRRTKVAHGSIRPVNTSRTWVSNPDQLLEKWMNRNSKKR